MGIAILPPDINEGEAGFSVSNGCIRYALTAIKGVGKPVIDAIVEERNLRGPYTNLKDFITRMADKDRDVNKRAIENFIKAGALDSLGATRKQSMSVYVQILDHITKDKKNNMAGQMSLFDETPVKPKLTIVGGPSRNSPCPCGSGRKYKNCCGK